MRLINLFIIVLVSFLVFEYAYAGKRYRNDENNDDTDIKNNQKGHEYKKYDRISNENLSKSKKENKRKWKPADDEESSEELQMIQYKKKDRSKKKKTLGDVFQEKKQKKQAKKQKFEKNVLKYFKSSNEELEEESSEEIIAPIRRNTKTIIDVDCDSSEERCD